MGWSTERFDCDSRNLVCMNIFQQLLFTNTNLKKTSNLGSDPTSSVDCCYCWCCFPSGAECCLDSPRPPGAAQTPTSRARAPPASPSSSPSHSWVRADGGYAAVAAVEDEMGCCRWPAARDGLPDQREDKIFEFGAKIHIKVLRRPCLYTHPQQVWNFDHP